MKNEWMDVLSQYCMVPRAMHGHHSAVKINVSINGLKSGFLATELS